MKRRTKRPAAAEAVARKLGSGRSEQALEEKVAAKLAPLLENSFASVESLRLDRSTDVTKAIQRILPVESHLALAD
jgi:hypothetical protein